MDITVSVSNAMPSTIKHLEEKPFYVCESRLEAQGYQLVPIRNGSNQVTNDDRDSSNEKICDEDNEESKILVEGSPVPSILIGYRLERVIVADMLKDNAKQVIKDTFSFDSWGRSPNAK